MQKTEQ